jgi:hypothetical protein
LRADASRQRGALRYLKAAHGVTIYRGAPVMQRTALPGGSPQAGYPPGSASGLPARVPIPSQLLPVLRGAPGPEGQTCGVTGDSELAAPRRVAIDQAGRYRLRQPNGTKLPTTAEMALTLRVTCLNRFTTSCGRTGQKFGQSAGPALQCWGGEEASARKRKNMFEEGHITLKGGLATRTQNTCAGGFH